MAAGNETSGKCSKLKKPNRRRFKETPETSPVGNKYPHNPVVTSTCVCVYIDTSALGIFSGTFGSSRTSRRILVSLRADVAPHKLHLEEKLCKCEAKDKQMSRGRGVKRLRLPPRRCACSQPGVSGGAAPRRRTRSRRQTSVSFKREPAAG